MAWFKSNDWKPFPFQKKAWTSFLKGYNGIVNAPTGSGKTYSLLLPVLAPFTHEKKTPKGLQLIWITPIRALAKEIKISAERAINGLGLEWTVGIRTGDTELNARQKQITRPPQILITTPESLHIILSSKKSRSILEECHSIVVDEWHELVGSKRGVQTELFISYQRAMKPDLKVWGISATIGNLEEAMDVLLGPDQSRKRILIRSKIKKKITVKTLFPRRIEKYPWAGHLGIRMLEKVVPIIQESNSTLIFTNTRAQCEIWYQKLLDAEPSLAGIMAMHHGSISSEVRAWVEEALYSGKMKAVVCTSSLDLGVDFRPVETIIQIGSPKGVARFIQRAGRSGHQPGATSKIYFVPTHTLEIAESAALRQAIKLNMIEQRIPYIRSWDVLTQYLVTLAVGGGFYETKIYDQVKNTFSYSSMEKEEWQSLLHSLTYGSQSLKAYDEYQRVGITNDGKYLINNRSMAQRHRLSIGTIMSDGMVRVQFQRGRSLGSVEEWFIAQLTPGDAFWFAGQPLEFIRLNGMVAYVKKSKKKTTRIPSYMGGRLSLSTEVSTVLRDKLYEYHEGTVKDIEMKKLVPLFDMQKERSALPNKDDFLMEYFQSTEGYHLVMYPFEGRAVHEGIAALIARRIAREIPISFSIAMNDYGFELLSDQYMDVDSLINQELFSTKNLAEDIQASINAVEMARRRFRDIACISGLIFTGYPGKMKKNRHLQSSAQLLFEVFKDYESDNLLYLQTHEEVMTFQLEEVRMRHALQRIQNQNLKIQKPERPTPLSFPIIVDRLSRDKLTSESIEDRVLKMKIMLEK